MKPLLPEQREALIDALIDNRLDFIITDRLGCVYLDDILVNGRRGFADYSDEELVESANLFGLEWRLEELGISTS